MTIGLVTPALICVLPEIPTFCPTEILIYIGGWNHTKGVGHEDSITFSLNLYIYRNG